MLSSVFLYKNVINVNYQKEKSMEIVVNLTVMLKNIHGQPTVVGVKKYSLNIWAEMSKFVMEIVMIIA